MLALGGVLLAYTLVMVGSWTRINGAGMTCPDWPLCRGAVVPVLQGGVVLEWLHRLLAFLETFIVAGLIVGGLRLRARVAGLGRLLIALGAVFVLQVGLGGVTIALANSPLSVMLHWGAAMLLLATLTSIAVVAFASDRLEASRTFAWRQAMPLLIATGWALATMCAGAYVSSSGAGLACPSVPGCGAGFFGQTLPQALQMTHRLLAAALVVFAALAAALLPGAARRATAALRVALVLLALQIVLGVLNVLWSLPPGLREAHAANAGATFLAFVVATVLASLEGDEVTQFGWAPRRRTAPR
jgi:heme A synthase